MGRAKSEIDPLELFDLLVTGETQKDIAKDLGVSVPTLARKISRIQEQQGILMQYRTLQSLELTSLQHRILEAITPDKINQAELKDLVTAFKILKDKEQVLEGKPSEIKGLVGYLVHLEKEKLAGMKEPFLKEEVEDGEFYESESESEDEEDIPAL